jgi:hypothetical protein
MQKLTNDQMENLVVGSENPYYGNLYTSIWEVTFREVMNFWHKL